eukprot:scaffold154751_cov34-Tisochrysis_lutea.AAC.5
MGCTCIHCQTNIDTGEEIRRLIGYIGRKLWKLVVLSRRLDPKPRTPLVTDKAKCNSWQWWLWRGKWSCGCGACGGGGTD